MKKGTERQGLYLHEVGLKKELENVFKTTNGGTSPASRLIIAEKITKSNSQQGNMQQTGNAGQSANAAVSAQKISMNSMDGLFKEINEAFNDFNSGETEKAAAKEKGMKDEKKSKNPPEAADPGEKDSAEKTAALPEGKADEGNKSAPADMPEKKEAKAADNDVSRKTDVSRDGEGAKPAKSAQDSIAEAMFAPAALDRLEAEIVSRMESRNRLVSRLKPVIGDFKGDGMTKRGVIEYACDALSLPEKTEAALNACLDRKEKEGIVRVDREGGTPGCAVIERFLRGE